MTLAERLKNPFVQQYILEIAFPLVGYFFFDWSIFIIAIYYLLDQLAIQSIASIRLFKIRQFNAPKASLNLFFVSILFFVLLYTVEGYVLYSTMGNMDGSNYTILNEEFMAFAKSELWLILPVLIFIYAFKDRFTFYMPRRYLLYDFYKAVKIEFLKLIMVFILIISFLYLWQLFHMNEIIMLVIFVILKITYDFTLLKFFNLKSLND